jgi:23S rRNA pseudoU1915 N3-methylase RlmH
MRPLKWQRWGWRDGQERDETDNRLRWDRPVPISDLTLPHELASPVLLGQRFRVSTILQGEPYHKGE